MREFKHKVRVIREEREVRQWQPPDVQRERSSSVAQDKVQNGRLLTAAQLAKLQEQAHAEGFEQGRMEGLRFGHNEGLEEGRTRLQSLLASLDDLMRGLDTPFQDLDDQVETEVVALVISMVRQLVRREIKLDPGQIVGVVREALAVLPVNSRAIRVILHPDDAETIRDAYTIGEVDQKWQIVDDPVIQRGGCRVTTETSQVDATLESRLNALIAPLLAGGRQRDPAGSSGKHVNPGAAPRSERGSERGAANRLRPSDVAAGLRDASD